MGRRLGYTCFANFVNQATVYNTSITCCFHSNIIKIIIILCHHLVNSYNHTYCILILVQEITTRRACNKVLDLYPGNTSILWNINEVTLELHPRVLSGITLWHSSCYMLVKQISPGSERVIVEWPLLQCC